MALKLIGKDRPVSKIMIAVPTRGAMDSRFVHDLMMLVAHSTEALSKTTAEILFGFCHGTYIDDARNTIVKDAIGQQVDAILWIDDDMRFPRDALLRLMRHRRPFVGTNYPTRFVEECLPVAIERISPPKRLTDFDGDGLRRVEAVGFGLVLTRMDVFHAIKYPWFECYYKDGQRTGEDVDLCKKAVAAGFNVEVDLALSRQVRHIGRFEFGLEHARAYLAEFATPEQKGAVNG